MARGLFATVLERADTKQAIGLNLDAPPLHLTINLRLDGRGAEVGFHPEDVGAKFVHDGLGVINQRRVVVERDDAHVIGREPEPEVQSSHSQPFRVFACISGISL